MKYYIADPHFYHRNIEDMDRRGFSSQVEMHDYMIRQWNSRVTDDDEVYVIGDFSFGRGVETWNVLTRLNGRISLIEGNHDFWFLDDREFVDTFENVAVYTEINDAGRKVILCHYPMPFYNGQFQRDSSDNNNTFMLHGHIHNTYDQYLLHRMLKELAQESRDVRDGSLVPTPFHLINAFCVYSDYVPLTLDEWQAVDEKIGNIIDEREKQLGHTINSDEWAQLNDEIVSSFSHLNL